MTELTLFDNNDTGYKWKQRNCDDCENPPPSTSYVVHPSPHNRLTGPAVFCPPCYVREDRVFPVNTQENRAAARKLMARIAAKKPGEVLR